jgi:putative membrane protein
MRNFLIRMLISMVGLWLATRLVSGVGAASAWDLLWAALALGIINALVRPIAFVLTLPITVLTLGLFLLVINAAMLGLAAWLIDGFTVGGFFGALLGAIVVSITSFIGNWLLKDLKEEQKKPD